MKKIRILFTIPNFLTAGSGREMFNIIERLDKNMFEPFIVVNEAGGSLFEEITGKGYTILVHRFSAENIAGVFNKIKEAKTLSRYYKPFGFDIWQSFNWSSDYTEALIAKFASAKYVYVKKNMNWGRRAWKVKSMLAKGIVARNTTMLKTILSGSLYKNKTHYITGAVDINLFYKKQSEYRNRLDIPASATVIGCVAQIVRVKDQATLIKATAGFDGLYLVLAGRFVDGRYADELRQLIKDLGIDKRVLLIGGIAEVNDFLNACDIFVLPTSKANGHEEGCPIALLEAMAACVACIASNVAGNNDLVQHEKTGLLFSAGDAAGLSACINRYMTDKKLVAEMTKNATGAVNKYHHLDTEAQSFGELYYKLVRN